MEKEKNRPRLFIENLREFDGRVGATGGGAGTGPDGSDAERHLVRGAPNGTSGPIDSSAAGSTVNDSSRGGPIFALSGVASFGVLKRLDRLTLLRLAS